MNHVLPIFPKQPQEAATLGFNWQSVLDQKGSTVTLSSATAASKLVNDGSDSSLGCLKTPFLETVSGILRAM